MTSAAKTTVTVAQAIATQQAVAVAMARHAVWAARQRELLATCLGENWEKSRHAIEQRIEQEQRQRICADLQAHLRLTHQVTWTSE